MRQVAFFDLDGTLTDPKAGITCCIAYALDKMGKAVPSVKELEEWIGPPLFDSFHGHLGSKALAADALRLYRDRFSRVGMYENEIYADVESVLEKVSRNCDAMFVVTSKPRVFAEPIVQHFGIAPFFERVYGSELDGTLADKGELIAHVMRNESIRASRITMIGDRQHDIAGARANGVRSIGALWGYGSRHELEDAGADVICQSIVDLPPLLGRG